MFGRGSIQLVRVFGIRIGVDPSWFLVLFYFIFVLSGNFRATLDTSDTVAYVTAVAAVLLFFASLILHELGHALVARRLGIGISGIDLWFFGGVAKMEREADSPGVDFKIAAAGPLVTLLVVVVCAGVGIAIAGFDTIFSAARFQSTVGVSPILALVSWLADINAVLFVLNLVPGFPLDGGRIARSAAWRLTGDRLRATRIAAALGQGFSYVMIGLGIYWLIRGSLIGGLWLIVLGWLLSQAARGAVAQTALGQRLESVTVADIMDREPVSIASALPVERARHEFFLRYRWPWFPVVDAEGRYVGLVREERLRDAADTRPVSDVMDAAGAEARIGEEATLDSVMASESLRRIGALMAVDSEGVLRGIVTLEQVRRALQTAATRQG